MENRNRERSEGGEVKAAEEETSEKKKTSSWPESLVDQGGGCDSGKCAAGTQVTEQKGASARQKSLLLGARLASMHTC